MRKRVGGNLQLADNEIENNGSTLESKYNRIFYKKPYLKRLVFEVNNFADLNKNFSTATNFDVILYFHTTNGEPSLRIQPIVLEVPDNWAHVKIFDINVDRDITNGISDRFKINILPTLILFVFNPKNKQHEEKGRYSGTNLDKINQLFEDNLTSFEDAEDEVTPQWATPNEKERFLERTAIKRFIEIQEKANNKNKNDHRVDGEGKGGEGDGRCDDDKEVRANPNSLHNRLNQLDHGHLKFNKSQIEKMLQRQNKDGKKSDQVLINNNIPIKINKPRPRFNNKGEPIVEIDTNKLDKLDKPLENKSNRVNKIDKVNKVERKDIITINGTKMINKSEKSDNETQEAKHELPEPKITKRRSNGLKNNPTAKFTPYKNINAKSQNLQKTIEMRQKSKFELKAKHNNIKNVDNKNTKEVTGLKVLSRKRRR